MNCTYIIYDQPQELYGVQTFLIIGNTLSPHVGNAMLMISSIVVAIANGEHRIKLATGRVSQSKTLISVLCASIVANYK